MLLMATMLPLAMQAQQALPYSYGFEDNDLTADGWTMVDCHEQTGITTSTSYVANGTYAFTFHWSTTPPQYLISPELTGTATGLVVEFSYKSASSTWFETFQVGYSTTDANVTSFTWDAEVEASNAWALYNNTFPAGTKYVAVKCTSNNAFYLCLDDFTFEAPATCAKPTAVTVADITTTSATISWTDNNMPTPSSWTIDVNGTEITGITANTYTIETLTHSTAYTVRVKANCSDEDASAYSNEITFSTLCEAVTTFPWRETFENYSANSSYGYNATYALNVPCWVNEHISGSGTSLFEVSTYNTTGNSTKQLRLPDMSNSTQTKLALPRMDIPAGSTYQFVIDIYRNASGTSYTSEGVRVFASTDGEIEGATELGFLYRNCAQTDGNVVTAETTTGWYTYEFEIPFTGDCYIILRGENQFGSATYMDNFIVRPAPTCLKPTDVASADVTAYGATISWTDNNDTDPENGWILLVNDEEVAADVNPFPLNTLDPETAYTVRVKAVCSGTDSSEWSVASTSFTTLPTCPAPTALTVDANSVTAHGATLSWTAGGEEESWIINYNGHDTTVIDNPFTFDNLTPATAYTVKVAAACSESDTSHWTSTVSFTTECETYVVTEANPFAENFNTLTAGIPNCWDNSEGTTTSTSYRWNYFATGYTGACLRFNSFTNYNGNTNMLKTPVLDITALATPRVTFMYKNPTGGDFSVFVSTDGGETYTTALATGLTGVTNWTPMSIALEELDATDSVMIVFQGTSNYGNGDAYIYLDNVVVEETPACLAPTNLSLDTVTTTYFQVSWTDNNEETPASWTVAYSIDGGETFIEITGIDHDSAVVCNFDAPLGDINVMAKVKANCNVDAESAWSDEINFVTPPTCPAPTAIEYSNVTGNSVTLSWTAGGEETEWILELNGTEIVVNENPITIDTLTTNTPYVVRIRAYCGVSDTSVWNSGFVGFVTPCDAISAENYSENFSGYTASNIINASNGVLPDCWNYIGTSGGYRPHVYNGTYSPTASDNCLVMTSGTSNYGGSTNFAVMPIFDDLTGKQLTFATAMESATMGTLTVGYVTDLTAESFVELETIPNNYYSNNRYVTHEVIVSSVPANARIAFRWHQTTSWYSCAIDDIAIEDMPACVTPIDVAAADSTITATTAIISWVDYNLTTPASWIINLNGVDTAVTENPFTFYNLTPETEYTVMVMAACTETDSSEWSSEITFTTLPTCTAPVDVTITGITTTTATVAWTDRNETDPENGWIINLNGIDTIVTENPFTFDDLTSATFYTVKVAAFCSETDTSDWSATANFITPCETVVVTDQEPYTEGFETEELICWTNDIISGSLEWEITDNDAEVGNQSVSFGGTYSSSGSAYLVSPVFDLTQITTEPQLSFYHLQEEYDDWYDTYNEELHVYYRTSPTDTWTLLADYTSNYEEFTLETMTLPNPSATYQIAFKGVEHNGYGVQLDEIVVEATPTCPKPTDLTASAITNTSAEIGWTPGGEETEWTVEVDGVDTIVTTNPITLTNLTPATTYTIRVKANCSADDQSQWSNELTFTTACDAITITDQFSEDFSGYTATNYNELGVMPTCWDAIAAATYGPHVYAGSYGPNGSNDNALIFTSGTSQNYGSPNLAVLPEFTNDLQGYTLSFKAKLESSYAPGVLTYGYITGVDQTTFTAIDTVAPSTTAQDFEYTLPSIPAGTRLAFCYSNSNIYYCCAIDDVVIAFIEEDTCATPSDVAVNNNVVTWTGDAANYNVTITANGETTTENVTGNSYTVTGLEDSTLVTVSVQAVCDEDNLSDWSEAVEFTYIATGINNYNLTANVFPNPTTGNVTIVLSHPMVNANVQVCDIYGRQISTHQVEGLQFELNLGNLAPGVYMLRFVEANAVLNTVKVVKR